MTTEFFDLSKPLSMPRPAWPRRAMDGIGALVAAYLARRRRRHAVARLSDHILRDIGIDPAEVRDVPYGRIPPILTNPLR